MLYTAVGCQV